MYCVSGEAGPGSGPAALYPVPGPPAPVRRSRRFRPERPRQEDQRDGPVRGSPVQHHAGAAEALRQVRRADPEGQRDVHDPATHPDGDRPDGAPHGAPQQHAAGERAAGALQHETGWGICLQVAGGMVKPAASWEL